MTDQTQTSERPTKSKSPKPSGVRDAVFMSYHRGHKYACLVRADGTMTKDRITHIGRYDVVFEDGGDVSKREFVGSFFGSRDQLVVGSCERQEIAKRPVDRPIHQALFKILDVPENIIGAKIRVELACGWVVEGLLTNVRLYSLGIQVPGDHKRRANILRHAIVGFEVIAEPGADEHSTKVIAYWEQQRKKHREKNAKQKVRGETASGVGDGAESVSASQPDETPEAVA